MAHNKSIILLLICTPIVNFQLFKNICFCLSSTKRKNAKRYSLVECEYKNISFFPPFIPSSLPFCLLSSLQCFLSAWLPLLQYLPLLYYSAISFFLSLPSFFPFFLNGYTFISILFYKNCPTSRLYNLRIAPLE